MTVQSRTDQQMRMAYSEGSEMSELAKQIADWKAANTRIITAGLSFERRARLKLAAQKVERFHVENPQLLNSPSTLSTGGEATGSMWLGMAVEPHYERLLKADQVIRAVCQVTQIPRLELLSPRRYRNVSHARFVAYYFMKNHTALSLPQIGRLCGGKDHTTVMNGLGRIARAVGPDRRKFDMWLAAVAERLGVSKP